MNSTIRRQVFIAWCLLVLPALTAKAQDVSPAASKTSDVTASKESKLTEGEITIKKAMIQELQKKAKQFSSEGKFDEAKAVSEECLSIQREVFGENSADVDGSLSWLADLAEQAGYWDEAFQRRADLVDRKISKLGENHWQVIDAKLAVKNVELLKSLSKEKLASYREATHRDSLLMTAVKSGKYSEAIEHGTKNLELRKESLGEQHPSYAKSLNNLATLFMRMGDDARAEPLYKQAQEIWKVALGEQHPSYATSLNNLAMLYAKLKRFDEAVSHHEQAIAISRKSLEATAFVLSERQQLAMNQSLRYQFDNYLQTCFAASTVPLKAVENVMLWKGSVLVRQRGLRVASTDPSIAEQFGKLQQAASRLSTLSQATPKANDLDNWRERIAKLTAEKEVLEADLMRSSATFRQAVQGVTFGQIRQAIPDDAVLVDYFEYKGKTGRSLLVSIVQREGQPVMLPLGSANEASEAIDVWRETFGMSPQAKTAGLKLRKQIWEPILEHIGTAKTILVSTDGVLGRLPLAALPGMDPGSYLIEDHRIALIPVPQLLPALVNEQGRQKVQRELMLMGDVDYDAAPDQDRSPENKESEPRKRPWERSELPESIRGDVRWNALPETRGEVEFIAGLYKRLYKPSDEAVLDLRKSTASETAFRTFAPECTFLHLATHGFFAAPDKQSAMSVELVAQRRSEITRMGETGRDALRGFNPGQLSGIVFAGANQPPLPVALRNGQSNDDDGIMTADEIAFMPFKGVKLVVLSACDTGLGEVAGGEGLLGIQRGFQIAGAGSTVASLWKVNDAATRRLMQEFYSNYLDKEMGMLDALRETQLWALRNPSEIPRGATREPDSEQPNRLPPQYWAPFVLSGDWR